MATLSEAMKETYASSPEGEVIIQALELQHSSFVDDAGNPAAFRITNQFEPVAATLEAGASMNPGELVTFDAFAFDLKLPGFEANQVPEISITVDNTDRGLMEQLELASSSTKPITVIYREYLLTDLSGPAMDPPLQMEMTAATAPGGSISLKASQDSVNNAAFPRRSYKISDFPDLAR